MRHSALLAAVTAAVLLAAGCTLGPDPDEAPKTAADTAESFVAAPSSEKATTLRLPPDDWWRDFADPVTTSLIEEALANNTDLKAAASRVLEAEAVLKGAYGARLPQVDYDLRGQRNKFSFVLPRVGRVGIYSTTFQQQLSVNYQVDLFGRLRRTQQAAWAQVLAAEADRTTLVDTLIAQVIRLRAQVSALERQLTIDRTTLGSWTQTAELVEARYRAGVVEAGELYLVRENRAAAAAAIPPIERSLAATRHALDILVGRRPGTGPRLPDTLPAVPALDPIPVGLPVSLLDRRPDLVAARMRFSAATAQVGAALAALYPDLRLTAGGGIVSDDLSHLLDTSGLIYSALANLVAPIFHGGQLRAQVEAARARAEAAAAQYASAVLQALREVEDGLTADATLQDQLRAARQRVEAATNAEELARWRYEEGTGALLDLLAADRAKQISQLALTLTQASLWDNRVGLYLALGGNWEPTVAGTAGTEAAAAATGASPAKNTTPPEG